MEIILEEMGFEASDLDGMVGEVASDLASRINNQGLARQLRFLNSDGHVSDDEIMLSLLQSKFSDWPKISVTGPKHESSTHANACDVSVEDVFEDHLYVCLSDGTHCTIKFDEVIMPTLIN